MKHNKTSKTPVFSTLSFFIYILAIALMLFKEMLVISVPLLMNIMIDGAVLGKELPPSLALSFVSLFTRIEKGSASILFLSFIMLLFYLAGMLSQYFGDIFNAVATEQIIKRLRDAVHRAIMRFSAQHYLACETGDLIQRCTTNIDTIRRTLNHFCVKSVAIVFSVGYIFSIMWSQSVKMALFSSIAIPIVFISSFCFFIYIKKKNDIFYEKEAQMTEAAQECLGGMRVVKAFSTQEFEMARFEKMSYLSKQANDKINLSDSLFWSFLDTLTFVQTIFVTLYASYLAYLGQLTVGQVVAFSQYVVMLISPIGHLGRILSNFGSLAVSIRRIKEVLNAPQEALDYEEDLPLLSGKVSFEHVSFAYPVLASNKHSEKHNERGCKRCEKEVLHDVSFSVEEGEVLGIMGKTGAGKTSIVYLLTQLYCQNTGLITIGGKDIREVPLRQLRSSIAVVLQEPFLYSISIKENIRLSAPCASDEEVIEVAKKAALHEDVMQLKDGYETIVGENGITLSGGQKQRLSIARTLLKKANIIVFDDSLSSVDSATDAKIRSAIRNMRGQKILIVISHRISSIMDADKIIVLEEGRVIEAGRHDELLQKSGVYKKVFDMQMS